MLTLTNNDVKNIEDLYKSFLYNLKLFLKNKNINSTLECYKILYAMLKNGQFCMNNSIELNDNFKYLSFSNLKSNGVQVMYGICCCRHVSEFINDVLVLLGFNSSLYYIQIDEKGLWHSSLPLNANHLTILLIENQKEYILDPMNNFILEKKINNDLLSHSFDTTSMNLQEYISYSDDNIKKIGKILTKYYNLQKLGIKYLLY